MQSENHANGHAHEEKSSLAGALPQFYAYPEPLHSEVPYKDPPHVKNPLFRGLALAIGVKVVAKVGLIQTYLYNNAGFDCLRGLKIIDERDFEARYEPIVIPYKKSEDEVLPDYTREGVLSTTPNGVPSETEPLGRFWSVSDYYEAYKSGKITPTDVVNAILPYIRRDLHGKHSTAFLASNVELILAAAEASTLRWKEGKTLGVLDGIPVACKDEVDIKGYTRTFATRRTYQTPDCETAWCVKKWEEQGAIVVGKTNMHEIGMDTTNLNPVMGTPRNPYNERYYTGGSSGGSGYAVAAGLVPFALGCDGGGSIRIPSSYCGLYGLKTSHARVSERPTPNLAGTNTVVGPMAADMSSIEVAYRVMATPDPLHTYSSLYPPPRKLTTPAPKIIGVYKDWFDRADEPVKQLCQRAIDHFKENLGYRVVDIHIPLIHEGQVAHALSILSEAVNGTAGDTSFLSPAVRVLLSVGSKCPASDYIQANRLRAMYMRHLAALYKQYPGLLILTPTTPTVGWEIKNPADLKYGCSDGDMSVRSMEYVWLANFSGCPCMQVPVGYGRPKSGWGSEGDVVPVGMMAMGEWGSEDRLIEWGFEAEAWFHGLKEGGRRRPPVWTDVLVEAGRKKAEMAASNGNGTAEVATGEDAAPAVPPKEAV